MTINLYKYQEELIKDVKEGKSVICNWARGGGKTFTLAVILFEVKPQKVVYEGFRGVKSLSEKVEELLIMSNEYKNSLTKYFFSREKIELEFKTGEKVTVTTEADDPDYVLLNDVEPRFAWKEIKSPYIAMITKNNYENKLQKVYDCKINEVDIYDLAREGLRDFEFIRENSCKERFSDEYAIKNKKQEDSQITMHQFKTQAFQKLTKQFLNTPDNKDTVLTRKNIMDMIKDLDQIKD